MVCYDKQSNDIAQGVDYAYDDHLNTSAGDQGLMFGCPCSETPDLMPAPIYYAHRLEERQAQLQLRKDGRLPFLRPMRRVMWPRTVWPPVWPASAKFKWLTPLVWHAPKHHHQHRRH